MYTVRSLRNGATMPHVDRRGHERFTLAWALETAQRLVRESLRSDPLLVIERQGVPIAAVTRTARTLHVETMVLAEHQRADYLPGGKYDTSASWLEGQPEHVQEAWRTGYGPVCH